MPHLPPFAITWLRRGSQGRRTTRPVSFLAAAIDYLSGRHAQALHFSDMATETSTIRVTRATRDLLAEQARERGLSVAALVGEIAEQRRREVIWRSEHQANRIDEQNSDAQAELHEWEGTLEDGLD